MITIAKNITEALAAKGEIRAGGTDFQERRRSRVSMGDIVDITRIPDLHQIEKQADGSTSIGALATVSQVGQHEYLQQHYPALTLPAQALATPQIREMASMGGVLAQRNRCWYYRHPDFECYKKGGDSCPAREGNHHFGVCFDLGPCAFPHASSIGMALLTYDASLSISSGRQMSIKDFFGDGKLSSKDNTLDEGEIITHIHLPTPMTMEKAAYFRLMSRAWAEWPLVEVAVRLALDGEVITNAKVAIGGVANIPFRLFEVERALIGQTASSPLFSTAAQLSTKNANPLPQTQYKVAMVERSVLNALEMAVE